ncbi:heme ABC transporter ATP-binding protein [Deinococcus marmoris]|uniref:heme ABC transporter ATP-binding protein n=1 Tax=Deinococcus marmoris TaxID=249408 RepID=UPI0006898CAD|nr:heme ABC transporter ATP-binding protein [Deinococcus marmoris]
MKLDLSSVGADLGARRIVDDVTLHVQAGEIVGLIGPNGSGKSTLLRTVYRMLRPVAGRVTLGTDDLWRLPPREAARRVAVVAQEAAPEFEFTVSEVVEMGRTPHKGAFARDTPQDASIVRGALARVDLQAFAQRDFATLSGGEKQRVMVARALAQEPKLLVLDEPTNHLDIHHQLELLELLRSLKLTILVTLHDLNLAAAYCDRLYLLDAGRLVACGAPQDVLTPELLRQVYRVDVVVSRHPVTARHHLSFFPLQRAVSLAPPEVL